jgi:hypothetical protein
MAPAPHTCRVGRATLRRLRPGPRRIPTRQRGHLVIAHLAELDRCLYIACATVDIESHVEDLRRSGGWMRWPSPWVRKPAGHPHAEFPAHALNGPSGGNAVGGVVGQSAGPPLIVASVDNRVCRTHGTNGILGTPHLRGFGRLAAVERVVPAVCWLAQPETENVMLDHTGDQAATTSACRPARCPPVQHKGRGGGRRPGPIDIRQRGKAGFGAG